ncbi:Endopolyphosphatase [Exophiala xenobiotica]|uniref:Endopolyphosphatase n=1 Tax=Lithohypha guttulata TaxID=1690604 RepID=A0ABR0K9S6_9EURO|nr:Endopolyphosphatase [Lithohypha guttulata]KAK5317996.1 Endopolyphosphatase [Exophiala xenobiotica]
MFLTYLMRALKQQRPENCAANSSTSQTSIQTPSTDKEATQTENIHAIEEREAQATSAQKTLAVIHPSHFVVWTGDSARHDNDERYPRTTKQIEQLNEFIVSKFDEAFGKPDNTHDGDPTNDLVVPVVPNFGNNDVLPHNIFTPGPNKWTRKFLTIWEKFVPQEQRHSFARGGWFFTEVIPNRLAVFSLNTLYFFDSNGAVDGCADPNEPGYEHFEWLRNQLEFLRDRNMKAILIGHVPPARTQGKQNWDETCYQKYTLWLRQFRDVIVGNLFGHMNIDHFALQDTRHLTYKFPINGIDDETLRDNGASISDDFNAESKTDYLSDLRQLWGNLPTPPKAKRVKDDVVTVEKRKSKKREMKHYLKEIGGSYGERFSLSVISPSVVPNFYPTLRIIEYNNTGLEHDHPALAPTSPSYTDTDDTGHVGLQHTPPGPWVHIEDFESDISLDYDYVVERKKKHRGKKKKKSKPNFRVPDPPSKTSPPGPGYSPQTLSFFSWKQLYANLTKINAAVAEELRMEGSLANVGVDEHLHEAKFKKHFTFELEYDTRDDKMYKMKDLTMRSWLNLAEKIGRTTYDAQSDMSGDFEDSTIEEDLEKEPKRSTYRDIVASIAVEDVDSYLHGKAFNKDLDLDLMCLLWLKKYQGKRLTQRNMPDNPSWPNWVVNAFSQKLEVLQNQLQLSPDLNESDDDYNDERYDSISEDDTTNSEDDDDSDIEDDELSATKKKHKKHKKKRKDQTLKKNHLWHAFVKRAFVGTKSDEELENEFG